ncbi:MAG: PAS domain S-box protein [Melioribacteraceae bacterium]|nr:PAS domain S-box protein [Melioribacteraceae bacterium]
MKKILKELLTKYFDLIVKSWQEKLIQQFGKKFSQSQIKTFVENSLITIQEIIDSEDYESADQYLIDIYNLFSSSKLNLLQISSIFSQGRFAIVTYLEQDTTHKYDPLILLGFLDEVIEQLYARYGMLHQEAQMKELERDRDRLAVKLDQNQKYLQNLMHSSDSAIMVIDENEKFIAWNKGAENMFGFTEDEVLGKPSSMLLPDEKKYKNELKTIREIVSKTGHIKITETERRSKSGKVFPVHITVTGLPGEDGKYRGRSVIINDVTEVKALQRQVDQSEKLAVIGQLAAGVAHEIGNPLTSISSLVQILQRKSEDEFITTQLANIKENIDRISKIVRELVDFSRPPGYEETFTQVGDVIKTALGIVKYDKRVKKVDFISDLDPELPEAKIVPDQLLQVFVNILINALDAIEGNGTIEVNSSSDEKFIVVEIKDNGIGMDKAVINKIFDPFFTTKGVGKGTGLGLSVSYGIIKRFGGDIIVESEKENYSKFIVKIPHNDFNATNKEK